MSEHPEVAASAEIKRLQPTAAASTSSRSVANVLCGGVRAERGRAGDAGRHAGRTGSETYLELDIQDMYVMCTSCFYSGTYT